MTFYSMDLFECPADATGDQLRNLGAGLTEVCSLSHHARDWGPYRLARWAEGRSMRDHWVDGAWVRVEASPEDVRAFFRELGEPPPPLHPDRRYLIQAEEF